MKCKESSSQSADKLFTDTEKIVCSRAKEAIEQFVHVNEDKQPEVVCNVACQSETLTNLTAAGPEITVVERKVFLISCSSGMGISGKGCYALVG